MEKKNQKNKVDQPNRPLFILAGNASFANRGSEAIVRSTIAILEREFGSCDFISSAESLRAVLDSKVMPLLNVKHVCRRKIRRYSWVWFWRNVKKRLFGIRDFPFLPYLSKASAFVGRAGDNFTLDYGLSLPKRQFAAAEEALKAGVPTILYGASIGPFGANPEFEKVAIEKFKKMTMICARESLTREYLAQHGVVDNVREVPDPAFVLEPVEPTLELEIREMLEEGCLGINISPLLGRYTEDEENWPEWAAKCLGAVDQKIDIPILLIPHVNEDYPFMVKILKLLTKTHNRIRLVDTKPNAPEMKWVISKVKAFVGARTHSTIAALSSCVPAESIGYSLKARGINRDIFGHLDWMLPLSELNPGYLAEVTSRLLSQAKEVRSYLEGKMPDYTSRAWAGGKCIREAMEGAGWQQH
jgi:colanic acid/amylovoran biosynthesis protein